MNAGFVWDKHYKIGLPLGLKANGRPADPIKENILICDSVKEFIELRYTSEEFESGNVDAKFGKVLITTTKTPDVKMNKWLNTRVLQGRAVYEELDFQKYDTKPTKVVDKELFTYHINTQKT